MYNYRIILKMKLQIINECMDAHRIRKKNGLINLENVYLTNSGIYIPPKMERICSKKEYDPIEDELYEKIMKTQIYISDLITDNNITIEKLSFEIIRNLDDNKRELNVDEIYCTLSSYSLWEVMEKIFEKYPIKSISKNDHKFNTLHKTLLPQWLWNFNHQLHIVSKHMQRNQYDIVNTINFLIRNNLVESIVEPTPREINYRKIKYETSIVLITHTIPRNLINLVYDDMYMALISNLTIDRIEIEINYTMKRYVELKKKNLDNYEFMLTNFGNYIKWICTLDYKEVSKVFVKLYGECKKNVFVENYKFFINILMDCIVDDKIWNMYFERCEWSNEYIKNVMNEIVNNLITLNYDEKTINIIIGFNENYYKR
jgi:hypothetical protein